MAPEVSIIIPWVNEYPQIVFTVQSIRNELLGYMDFEIILIDNYCKEVEAQGFPRDGGFAYFEKLVTTGVTPYIKLLRYEDKLSHWNAKNLGISVAEAPLLFFCDSHIMIHPGSLRGMIEEYKADQTLRNGSYHLPISYMLDKTSRRLIYTTVANPKIGLCHYRFYSYDAYVSPPGKAKAKEEPIRVGSMSTCGMLIAKAFMESIGGWPEDMGIYGGGENYLNFVQAVLGRQVRVRPGPPIYHYAAPRGYRWNHFDWIRNRMIAIYLAGGDDWLGRCAKGIIATKERGTARQIQAIVKQIYSSDDLIKRRVGIEEKEKISLNDWIEDQATSDSLITFEETWR